MMLWCKVMGHSVDVREPGPWCIMCGAGAPDCWDPSLFERFAVWWFWLNIGFRLRVRRRLSA